MRVPGLHDLFDSAAVLAHRMPRRRGRQVSSIGSLERDDECASALCRPDELLAPVVQLLRARWRPPIDEYAAQENVAIGCRFRVPRHLQLSLGPRIFF